MKRKHLTVAVVISLIGAFGMTSCIGSFSMTKRVLSWNNTVGSKFVNELVFFAFWILPVYEVTCLADLLVLNSIEFWSGSNPMAKGTKIIDGQDGRYLVKCDGKGYTIISENDKSEVRLDFDEDTRTWSLLPGDGESYVLMTYVDDTHVLMPGVDGTMVPVELTAQGVDAYRTLAAGHNAMAINR